MTHCPALTMLLRCLQGRQLGACFTFVGAEHLEVVEQPQIVSLDHLEAAKVVDVQA